MIGKMRSVRDSRDPLMKSLVQPSRHPIRGQVRLAKGGVRTLVHGGSARPAMYVCARCSFAYSPNHFHGPEDARHAAAREQAERCCDNRCRTCRAPVQRFHARCEDCSRKDSTRQRRAWAKRAKVVTLAETDWIFAEGYGYNEGYFAEMSELVEWCADEGCHLPSYVNPCREIIPSLDADHILEQLDEDLGCEESALDRVDGVDELVAAIEAFNTKNANNHVAWMADSTRVIILDADAFNAEFGTDDHGRPDMGWRDKPPSVDPITMDKYRLRLAELTGAANTVEPEAA